MISKFFIERPVLANVLAILMVLIGAVALYGATALVGAQAHDQPGQPGAGAAYVFTRSGAAWTQASELSAADAATGLRGGGGRRRCPRTPRCRTGRG